MVIIIAAKKIIVYLQLNHGSSMDHYAGLQNHHASLWDGYIWFCLAYHVCEVECCAVFQQHKNPNYATHFQNENITLTEVCAGRMCHPE